MLNRRTLISASLAAVLLLGLVGLADFAHWYKSWMAEFGPGWHAMAWPFPRDGWDEGRAWRNGDTEVYIRPKLGFCSNCETGVVDDSEVDRVTDIDLLDERFQPLGGGERIHITDLPGRARLYRIVTAKGPLTAEGIAVSLNCDLVVAIVVGKHLDSDARKEAQHFLESNTVQVWVNRQLEGR